MIGHVVLGGAFALAAGAMGAGWPNWGWLAVLFLGGAPSVWFYSKGKRLDREAGEKARKERIRENTHKKREQEAAVREAEERRKSSEEEARRQQVETVSTYLADAEHYAAGLVRALTANLFDGKYAIKPGNFTPVHLPLVRSGPMPPTSISWLPREDWTKVADQVQLMERDFLILRNGSPLQRQQLIGVPDFGQHFVQLQQARAHTIASLCSQLRDKHGLHGKTASAHGSRVTEEFSALCFEWRQTIDHDFGDFRRAVEDQANATGNRDDPRTFALKRFRFRLLRPPWAEWRSRLTSEGSSTDALEAARLAVDPLMDHLTRFNDDRERAFSVDYYRQGFAAGWIPAREALIAAEQAYEKVAASAQGRPPRPTRTS